jgi:hypothetical protein
MYYSKNTTKIKIFLVKIRKILGIDFAMRIISDIYEKRNNMPITRSPIQPIKHGWSVIITTDGKSPEFLHKLINSIETELNNSPYEIIIVGPKNLVYKSNDPNCIKHIIYKELNWSPGWITYKKNLGVKSSSYDKIVVCHDYLIFLPGWKNGYDKFGENFNICTNIIINNDGSRFRDWITWDYPDVGAGLLPYHAECTEYQIIGGTYFVVKRNFYLENLLDEKLRWGEGEDVEWSKKIRQKTKFKFNPYSTIQSSKQKKAQTENWINATKKLYKIFS